MNATLIIPQTINSEVSMTMYQLSDYGVFASTPQKT